MFARFSSAYDRIVFWSCTIALWFSGLLLAISCGLILVEIFFRNVMSKSTHVMEEFVSYGLAAMVFLALGRSLRDGSLIRIDILLSKLSTKARRLAEIAIIIVTAAMMVFLLSLVWTSVAQHWSRGTMSWTGSGVPTWLPESCVLLGLFLFFAQLLASLFDVIAGKPLANDELAAAHNAA